MAKQQQNRISERRKAKGWSQQQLADAVGVHWITISKLERGITRLTFEWVSRIAEALAVDPSDLLAPDRWVRNVPIFGRALVGGIAIENDDRTAINDKLFRINVSALFDPSTVFLKVEGTALYPYFRDGDIIGFQWVTDDDLLNKRGERDFGVLTGRFCLAVRKDGSLVVGVLSVGSSQDAINLHNANSPPFLNIEPKALGQATVSFMSVPIPPPPHDEEENS